MLVQGVALGSRAPQMRRFSWVSVSLTVVIQDSVQVRAQGVPKFVCVAMVVGVLFWLPISYLVGVARCTRGRA